MGFALYQSRDLLWAKGTHEYRPMGVAVIAAGSVFAPRDFDRRRPQPSSSEARFVGYFASLGQINGYLKTAREKGTPSKAYSALFE